MSHPEYVLPNTPHAGYRYKMAMKHVETAKAAGKSAEEIHEVFNIISNFFQGNSQLAHIDNNIKDKILF